MKIIFLGTGAPSVEFNPLRAGASEIVLFDNNAILFDCGRWVSMRLAESGIRADTINYLFFTHSHHLDHTMDLPSFLCFYHGGRISRNVDINKQTLLKIRGPRGTENFLARVKEAFKGDLPKENLWERIDVKDIDEGLVVEEKAWKIRATRTLHMGVHGEPSLGYRIESKEGSIVISGDVTLHHTTGRPSLEDRGKSYSSNVNLKRLARDADVYIMDADIAHTTPEDLGRAAAEAGVKTAVLTHIHNTGFRSKSETNVDILQSSYDDFTNEMSRFFSGKILVANDLKILEI